MSIWHHIVRTNRPWLTWPSWRSPIFSLFFPFTIFKEFHKVLLLHWNYDWISIWSMRMYQERRAGLNFNFDYFSFTLEHFLFTLSFGQEASCLHCIFERFKRRVFESGLLFFVNKSISNSCSLRLFHIRQNGISSDARLVSIKFRFQSCQITKCYHARVWIISLASFF